MPPPRESIILSGFVMMVVLTVMSAGCADSEELARVRAMQISDVDLTGAADGSYPGEFTYGKFKYVVMTTIDRQRITGIDVLANRNEWHARKAEQVIPRIIEAQTPNVDAVTGATTTSKALMKAVEQSLHRATKY